jgi:hypothetical protein
MDDTFRNYLAFLGVILLILLLPVTILASSTTFANITVDTVPDYQFSPIQNEGLHSDGVIDLYFKSLEVWWADINNGTLYVRYSVTNIGESYHDGTEPILLNITLANESSNQPFAYIEQFSYLDPYTWYYSETLSGCVQISLQNKPAAISAYANQQLHIPEQNMQNNHRLTQVYNGILLEGIVKKQNNHTTTPVSNATLRRCNETSLQSQLRIRFDTNETGHYKVSLYPKTPLTESHTYHLIITDTNNDQTLLYETPLLNYNESNTQQITFQGSPPKNPMEPIGFPLALQGFPNFILTSTFDTDRDDLWYKIKWGYEQYSQWIGPFQSFHPLFISHTYDESGFYPVKVIAKDDNGMMSSWSEVKTIVTLPHIFF